MLVLFQRHTAFLLHNITLHIAFKVLSKAYAWEGLLCFCLHGIPKRPSTRDFKILLQKNLKINGGMAKWPIIKIISTN